MPLSQYNIAPPHTRTEFNNLSNDYSGYQNIASAITPATNSNLEIRFARKRGKFIEFLISGHLTGQYGYIATISSPYAPSNSVQIHGTYQIDGYNVPTYAQVSSEGYIYFVNRGYPDKDVTAHAFYMIT